MSCVCDLGVFSHCDSITFNGATSQFLGNYTYNLYANGEHSVYHQVTNVGTILRIYGTTGLTGNYIGLNLNEHTIYEVEIFDPNGDQVVIGGCTKFRFEVRIIPTFSHS